jgi:cellobiose phosphorylase
MRYGYFDTAAGEYVIERPDTPLPWSNYIGSADFGGVVTNHGGGYTFYRSAAQGRLTRFRFNSPAAMNPGKYVYVRDCENGLYWTPGWLQRSTDLQVCVSQSACQSTQTGRSVPRSFDYSCRFGTGYAVIRGACDGLACETTYFIPMGQTYEVWRVKITNTSNRPRKASLFPFVETQCNWNAVDDNFNLQYTQYIARTDWVYGMLDIGSNVNMPADPGNFQNKDQKRHTFFGLAGAEAAGYDGDLTKFLGVYGDYSRPASVLAGACGNTLASGDHPCAALQVDVELAPGETKTFCVVFGVGMASKEGVVARAAMLPHNAADSELEKIKRHWRSRMGCLDAKTPDAEFNAMVNLWAPYNNLMTFYWSRTASLVYAGERDGLGFRDTLQDIVGAASLVTDEAAARLELMITGQLSNGGAIPVVKPFAHRPGHEKEGDHYRSDDCLWLFNAVPEYVKETGDIGFYRKVLPYADKGSATVLGHLRRAMEFNLERTGANGLPCGLAADWNDCLRFGEKGETIFVAMQLRLALREYLDIATRLNETAEAAWARATLATFDATLEKAAWDGGWYMRGYRYDGFKFGSSESEEGKIFVNPQTWAVLSGAADAQRGRAIMDEVDKRLATKYGIALCAPPFVTTDPDIVRARLMNPGMKENGGIFYHVQGWAVMVEAELGRPDRAWKYMKAVLPCSFNDIAEIRQVEPYAVCQSTHSEASPRFGAGRVSWLSGSAVWNYYAMTHSILGVCPHYDGLEIKPCLPPGWSGYEAVRTFRGKRFDIKVTNDRSGSGKTSLKLNGKPVEGVLLPAGAFEAVNNVEAVYGGV